MARQSIETEGLIHANPIPAATRIGPLVESSIVVPYNPGTRDVPADFDTQVDNLFEHMGAILAAAGGGWDDMAKATFFVADPGEARKALNRPWVEHFPDPQSRPSRHTMKVPIAGEIKVSCVFTAYISA